MFQRHTVRRLGTSRLGGIYMSLGCGEPGDARSEPSHIAVILGEHTASSTSGRMYRDLRFDLIDIGSLTCDLGWR